MMRDDDHPPDLAPPAPPRGTLPPNAKTLREVFAGLERIGKEIGLPVLVLLAAHWDVIDKKDAAFAFIGAVSTVLGGNFALRKAEQAGDK
jgi:hypothetical protein